MRLTKWKKPLALCMVFVMLLSMFPTALATEPGDCADGHNYVDGLCSVCGAAEPVEEVVISAPESTLSAGTEMQQAAVLPETVQNVVSVAVDPCANGHSYANGACTVCGAAHADHVYENGVCSVCGAAHADHVYDNGVCTVCGAAHADHVYANGVCTVCGAAHADHVYENGVCTVCGAAHADHVYENGVCTVCGALEPNNCANGHSYVDGVCTVCGATHEEHDFVDGVCTVCGEKQAAPEDEEPAADEEDEPAVTYPEQNFSRLWGDLSIVVYAPEGALPAGTEMILSYVSSWSVRNAVVDELGEEPEQILAVDISFRYNDAEVEPRIPVQVKFNPVTADDSKTLTVMHVDDESGALEVLAPTPSDAAMSEEVRPVAGEGEVLITTDSFSTYVVTVGNTTQNYDLPDPTTSAPDLYETLNPTKFNKGLKTNNGENIAGTQEVQHVQKSDLITATLDVTLPQSGIPIQKDTWYRVPNFTDAFDIAPGEAVAAVDQQTGEILAIACADSASKNLYIAFVSDSFVNAERNRNFGFMFNYYVRDTYIGVNDQKEVWGTPFVIDPTTPPSPTPTADFSVSVTKTAGAQTGGYVNGVNGFTTCTQHFTTVARITSDNLTEDLDVYLTDSMGSYLTLDPSSVKIYFDPAPITDENNPDYELTNWTLSYTSDSYFVFSKNNMGPGWLKIEYDCDVDEKAFLDYQDNDPKRKNENTLRVTRSGIEKTARDDAYAPAWNVVLIRKSGWKYGGSNYNVQWSVIINEDHAVDLGGLSSFSDPGPGNMFFELNQHGQYDIMLTVYDKDGGEIINFPYEEAMLNQIRQSIADGNGIVVDLVGEDEDGHNYNSYEFTFITTTIAPIESATNTGTVTLYPSNYEKSATATVGLNPGPNPGGDDGGIIAKNCLTPNQYGAEYVDWEIVINIPEDTGNTGSTTYFTLTLKDDIPRDMSYVTTEDDPDTQCSFEVLWDRCELYPNSSGRGITQLELTEESYHQILTCKLPGVRYGSKIVLKLTTKVDDPYKAETYTNWTHLYYNTVEIGKDDATYTAMSGSYISKRGGSDAIPSRTWNTVATDGDGNVIDVGITGNQEVYWDIQLLRPLEAGQVIFDPLPSNVMYSRCELLNVNKATGTRITDYFNVSFERDYDNHTSEVRFAVRDNTPGSLGHSGVYRLDNLNEAITQGIQEGNEPVAIRVYATVNHAVLPLGGSRADDGFEETYKKSVENTAYLLGTDGETVVQSDSGSDVVPYNPVAKGVKQEATNSPIFKYTVAVNQQALFFPANSMGEVAVDEQGNITSYPATYTMRDTISPGVVLLPETIVIREITSAGFTNNAVSKEALGFSMKTEQDGSTTFELTNCENGKGYLIQYKVMATGSGNINLNNTVSVLGHDNVWLHRETSYSVSQNSGYGGYENTLRLLKSDSVTGQGLNGVSFTFVPVNAMGVETGAAITSVSRYESGFGDGFLITGLDSNTIYRVTETTPPGYTPSEPFYICFWHSQEAAPTTVTVGGESYPVTVFSASIAYLGVPNTPDGTGKITLKKKVTVPEGETVDTNQEFTFTLAMTSSVASDLRAYEYTSPDGVIRTLDFTGGARPTVTLKHNQSITIGGLPETAKISIVETPVEGYVTSNAVTGGTNAQNNGNSSGTLDLSNGDHTVIFTNYKPVFRSLTISKTVVDEGGIDTDAEFLFDITMTSDVTADYATYSYVGSGGKADGSLPFTTEQPTVTVSLKHGESITITNLPSTATVSVHEHDSPDYLTSNAVSGATTATNTSLDSGDLDLANGNYTVAYTNSKKNLLIKLKLYKYDPSKEEHSQGLFNAQFYLYKLDTVQFVNNAWQFPGTPYAHGTTDNRGTIQTWYEGAIGRTEKRYLDAGEYLLVEHSAPFTYDRLTDPIYLSIGNEVVIGKLLDMSGSFGNRNIAPYAQADLGEFSVYPNSGVINVTVNVMNGDVPDRTVVLKKHVTSDDGISIPEGAEFTFHAKFTSSVPSDLSETVKYEKGTVSSDGTLVPVTSDAALDPAGSENVATSADYNEFVLTLKDNEYIRFTELPYTMSLQFTEDENSRCTTYNTVTVDGSTTRSNSTNSGVLDLAGGDYTVDFYNRYSDEVHTVKLIKVDAESGAKLANARFELWRAESVDGDGQPLPGESPAGSVTTNSAGEWEFESRLSDFTDQTASPTYVLIETAPPENYEPLSAPIKFTVTASGITLVSAPAGVTAGVDGSVYTLTIQNEPDTHVDLTLSKTVTASGGLAVDRNKQFTFTLTMTSSVAADFTSYNYDGSKSGTLNFSSSDHTATVTLKHNQSITIRDLPQTAKISIAETAADGYTTSNTASPSGTGSTALSTGTLDMANGDHTVTFTNNRETTSVTLSKTVTATGGMTVDTNQQFLFTLTLTGTVAGDPTTYSYTGLGIDGGTLTFTNGTATISLKHDQSITINGLPASAKLTVAETAVNGYTTSNSVKIGSGAPTTTASGSTGELDLALGTYNISYTNTRTPQNRNIKLVKVDKDDNTKLNGVSFELYKASDVETVSGKTQAKSGAEPFKTGSTVNGEYTFSGVPEGEYYLFETSTPTGYLAASGPIHLTVGLDTLSVNGCQWASVSPGSGEIHYTLTVTNTKNPTRELTVTKTVTASTGFTVDSNKQFTFTLTIASMANQNVTLNGETKTLDGSGKLTFTLTHGEKAVIAGIAAGAQYTVEETAEQGYTTTYTVGSGSAQGGGSYTGTLSDNTTVDFTNTRSTVYRNIKLVKVDADDDTVKLPNVSFELYKASDVETVNNKLQAKSGAIAVKSDSTNSNGELQFNNVPEGEYYLFETSTPSGYLTANGPVHLTITPDAVTTDTAWATVDKEDTVNYTLTVTNSKNPTKQLKVTKTVTASDGFTVDSNKQFTFTLTIASMANQNVTLNGVTKTLDGSGKLTFTLKDGEQAVIAGITKDASYTIAETAEEGYDTTYKVGSGSVQNGGTCTGTLSDSTTVAFTNNRVPVNRNIVLTKVDAASASTKLNGAVFSLYKKSDVETVNNKLQPKSGADTTWANKSVTNGVLTFQNVPEGNYYLFEDTAPTDYQKPEDPIRLKVGLNALSIIGGCNWATIGTPQSGTIYTLTVTNTKIPTADLTLSKTVVADTGFSIDANQEFTFRLTMLNATAEDYAKSYSYRKSSGSTTLNYGTFKFSGDEHRADFTLKHNESITIVGLPKTATVTVVETTVDGYATSNTVSGGTTANNSSNSSGALSLTNGDTTVAFTNTRTAQNRNIKLIKVDAASASTKLNGAVFSLYKESDVETVGNKLQPKSGAATTWANKSVTNGELTFENVPEGEYYLFEDTAPTDYQPITEPIHLTVGLTTLSVNGCTWATVDNTKTGEIHYTLTVKNSKVPTADLTLSKTVVANGLEVNENDEFTFTLTMTSAVNDDFKSYDYVGTNGKANGTVDFSGDGHTATVTLKGGQSVTIGGLPQRAKITVEETAETEYTTSNTVTPANAAGADKTDTSSGALDLTKGNTTVAFTNTRAPQNRNIKLIKVDAANAATTLPNVSFKLYAKDDVEADASDNNKLKPKTGAHVVKEGSTNASGELTFENVQEGEYYLFETSTPTGYEAASGPILLTVGLTTLSVNGSTWATVNDTADGEIHFTLTVTNTKVGTKQLSFSKNVTGDGGSHDKYFKFRLSVTGVAVGTKLTVQVLNANGNALEPTANDATTYEQDAMRTADGVTELTCDDGTVTHDFYLSHGDRVVITNIPIGASYTIDELDKDRGGYATTIPSNATGTVADADIAVVITNERVNTPPTGLSSDPRAAVLYMMFLSLLTMSIFAVAKSKRRDEQ